MPQLVGLIVGAVPWLKSLIIGDNAPFRVVEDSIELLGYLLIAHLDFVSQFSRFSFPVLILLLGFEFRDGTIPSVILVLGGNLVKGMIITRKLTKSWLKYA